MPLTLQDPRPGKSPFYTVRGTHRGVHVHRSTKTGRRDQAKRILERIRDEIDRAFFSGQIGPGWRPGAVVPDPLDALFMDAAARYMAAGGADQGLDPIVDALGDRTLRQIDQSVLDVTAAALFPDATPATRNRWFYTPVSAILKHAGDDRPIRRPKGWRGAPRVHWLTPDQAGRMLAAAAADDAEFGVFLATLLYTGMRLSEATGLTLDRLNLSEAWAWTPETKNGEPRLVHLPPALVAALAGHPRGLTLRERSSGEAGKADRPSARLRGSAPGGADAARDTQERLFRFVKCGRLYSRLRRVREAAGPDCGFVTFHTFRHTWATWMRRYGGLDTRGLVDTGAWRSLQSAAVYEHVIPSEEARRADALPDVTPKPAAEIGGKSVENRKRPA